MDFKFKDVVLGKGWLELLVLGDTRTGKCEAALRLSDHYNAGVMKSCEGATFAGLVGGAEQAGSSWMVRWGTITLNRSEEHTSELQSLMRISYAVFGLKK